MAHHHPALAHHFDSLEQQKEAATLGMWVFLVTEVLFFGGLFGFAMGMMKFFGGGTQLHDATVAAVGEQDVPAGHSPPHCPPATGPQGGLSLVAGTSTAIGAVNSALIFDPLFNGSNSRAQKAPPAAPEQLVAARSAI